MEQCSLGLSSLRCQDGSNFVDLSSRGEQGLAGSPGLFSSGLLSANRNSVVPVVSLLFQSKPIPSNVCRLGGVGGFGVEGPKGVDAWRCC